MQACKYNTKEFAPFVSGKKRIKPQLTDDWEVFTGGFQKSTDVLNLSSKKLNQKIYDCGTRKFFEFMLDHNVTMSGNEIVGTFVIGSQRVLRSEADYEATMGVIKERKQTLIPKSEWKSGHRYETVCGSTFNYIGMKYITRSVSNKNGIKLGKPTKNYLAVGVSSYYNASGIDNVTTKKVVKDLGFYTLAGTVPKKIKNLGTHDSNIVYISDTNEAPEFRMVWTGGSTGYLGNYIMDGAGFTYRKLQEKGGRGKDLYVVIEDDGKGNQVAGEEKIEVDTYYDRKKYVTRNFKWVEVPTVGEENG